MSRRTKLIITALFLVLVSIPVVYVVLTWSPAEPLRFRVVGDRTVETPRDGRTRRVLEIEIENTSMVPVQTMSGSLILRDQDGEHDVGPAGLLNIVIPHSRNLAPVIIPSHSSIRREAWLDAYEHRDPFILKASLQGATIQYWWHSATKAQGRLIFLWLKEHGPEFASKLRINLEHEKDEAPLETGS